MAKRKGIRFSANQVSIRGVAILLAILIIVAAVGYSEVMFLQVISHAFPDGILKVVAMIGGVSTGLSVLTLLLAKAYWFRPGNQMVGAWVFTAVEMIILVLNVLLSFDLANGPLKAADSMQIWYGLCPTSPLFGLFGWTILIMFDRTQVERHDQMEMEDEQRTSELDHQRMAHEAGMKLRAKMLTSQAAYMDQFMDAPEVQEALKKGTHAMAMEVLSDLIGKHVAAMRHASTNTTGDLSGLFDQMDNSQASGTAPTATGDIYAAGLPPVNPASKSKVKYNTSS